VTMTGPRATKRQPRLPAEGAGYMIGQALLEVPGARDSARSDSRSRACGTVLRVVGSALVGVLGAADDASL